MKIHYSSNTTCFYCNDCEEIEGNDEHFKESQICHKDGAPMCPNGAEHDIMEVPDCVCVSALIDETVSYWASSNPSADDVHQITEERDGEWVEVERFHAGDELLVDLIPGGENNSQMWVFPDKDAGNKIYIECKEKDAVTLYAIQPCA